MSDIADCSIELDSSEEDTEETLTLVEDIEGNVTGDINAMTETVGKATGDINAMTETVGKATDTINAMTETVGELIRSIKNMNLKMERSQRDMNMRAYQGEDELHRICTQLDTFNLGQGPKHRHRHKTPEQPKEQPSGSGNPHGHTRHYAWDGW
ncbi:hypothetical protein KIPB_007343 [Kipferlia bialata]|uniref:Uncharacterized protein n=1 Tax=Kipferlia bialata TaxID=797122 RepID=A0A9K3D053_9EUKA|nr:hypothetical protein KIPB_007343 [Kipferlia bialata]|eukprot:g7343.t1